MEFSVFFGIVLIIFIGLTFLITKLAGTNIKNLSDYFLANKQLQTFTLTLTLLTNQIGGNFLYGITQHAYILGYYAIFYALGINVGFALLALGIAKKLKNLSVPTIATLFTDVFHSHVLRKLAALGSIISLWTTLTFIIALFSSMLFHLGLNNNFIILAFWVGVIINVASGGLGSIAFLDVIKQIFITIIFISIFIYTFFENIHSAIHIFDLVDIQDLFSQANFSWQYLLQSCILSSLFCLIQQDLAQCFFASKNAIVADKSARYAMLGLMIFSLMPLYFGMQARLFNAVPVSDTSPLVLFLQTISDYRIFTLILIAIISVVTATTTSFICAISANIVQDFKLQKEGSDGVVFAKKISFFVGTSALAASNIFSLPTLMHLSQCYKLYVGAFFVPTCLAFIYKDLPAYIAWSGIIFGMLAFIINIITPIPALGQLAPLFLCAIATIASLFFKGLYNL